MLGALEAWVEARAPLREMQDLRLDQGQLKKLADASGGKLLKTKEEVAGLFQEIDQRRELGFEIRRIPLWNHYLVVVGLLGGLALLWILGERKKALNPTLEGN